MPSPKFCLPPRNEAEKQSRRELGDEIFEPKNNKNVIFESIEELLKFRPDLANILLNETGYPNTKYPYYKYDARDCGDYALIESNGRGDTVHYHEIPWMKYVDVHVFVRVTSDSIEKTPSENEPCITFYGFPDL